MAESFFLSCWGNSHPYVHNLSEFTKNVEYVLFCQTIIKISHKQNRLSGPWTIRFRPEISVLRQRNLHRKVRPKPWLLLCKTSEVICLLWHQVIIYSLEIEVAHLLDFLLVGSCLLVPGLLDQYLLVLKHRVIHLKGAHNSSLIRECDET